MLFVLIAFLPPILHALSCILDSYFSNNIFKNTSTLVFFASITNIIIIPFLFLFGMPTVPPLSVLGIVALVALIDVLYLFPWYIALKHIDTSISVALFSLGEIALPFLAWFIVGEKLGTVQYLGFAIILLPSILMNMDFKKLKLNIGFWLMLMVAIMLALAVVLDKYALGSIDSITLIFWRSIMTTTMILSFLVVPRIRRDITQTLPRYIKNVHLFLSNELLSQFGSAATVVALVGLPCLTVDSISATQSIFTLVWGAVLYKLLGGKFKENLSRSEVIKKIVSFVCIVIGIYMVLI